MKTSLGYVDAEFLDNVKQRARRLKKQSYEAMCVLEGDSVLDVGCGPGTDTIELRKLVGHTGSVTGIDHDQEMVDEANKRAARYKNVHHVKGSIYESPFEDDSFDSCRSERVFQHLMSPHMALANMVRATKVGGNVVVVDTDWNSLSFNTTVPEISRKFVTYYTEGCVFNGSSGRTLYGMFNNQKLLKDVKVSSFSASITDYNEAEALLKLDGVLTSAVLSGAINHNERVVWEANQKHLSDMGSFFVSLTFILCVGTKK